MPQPKSLAAAYAATVLAPNVLHMLCQDVAKQGIAPALLFEGTGLTVKDLEDPSRKVSFRQSCQVFRRALDLLPDGGSGLGLAMGSHPISTMLGVVGLAMIACNTLEEGLRIGIEYRDMVGSLVDLSLHVGESEFALELHERFPNSGLPASLVFEGASAGILGVCKAIVGPQFKLIVVELQYPKPSYAGKYAEVFDCPVRFGAPHNRLVADSKWLSLPLQTQDSLVARQAMEILRRSAPPDAQDAPQDSSHGDPAQALERLRQGGDAQVPAPDFAETLKDILRADPVHMRSVEDVAEQLQISPLRLRRLLLERGLSFREIRNGIKAEMAFDMAEMIKHILRGNSAQMPGVEEVAEQLHITAPKLRRLLLDEGLSFREIRNGVKAELAIERLSEGKMTNADAAANLGFSDIRYFRRVFKRWTGATPSTFKTKKRGETE